MQNTKIEINSDMGEGIGLHSFGNDEALMPLVDAINLACGWHAGDPAIMDQTVKMAVEHGVKIGAHPGLPDLTGFGRRRMVLEPSEVGQIIRYQVGALTAFLGQHGAQLNHIKPHGALYGILAGDDELMREAAKVNLQYGVPFFGLAGTAHERICADLGVEFIPELYVDLNYSAEGSLIIQRKPEQADPSAVKERIRRALSGQPILAVDGTEITIPFASICVHSDSPNAPEVAAAARSVVDDFASSAQ